MEPKPHDQGKQPAPFYQGRGIAVGAALGLLFGLLVGQVAVGLVMGIAVGVAIDRMAATQANKERQ